MLEKMMARLSIYFLIVALMVPYLYDRYLGLSPMWSNRPGKLQETYNIKTHEIKFAERIRNCEDVVLDEEKGIAILSCNPGRDKWNTVMGTFSQQVSKNPGILWAYNYANTELGAQEAIQPLELVEFDTKGFHPLGIEWHSPTNTLYVINVGVKGPAIEVFSVDINNAEAKHKSTFTHPLLYAPNSLQVIENEKLYVTNDHFIRAAFSPLLSKLETFGGIPLASVVSIDINNSSSGRIEARIPFANGVVMLNSSTLAVASSSKTGVYFYEIQPDLSLAFKRIVRTPSPVDNLSVDANGKLLLAGHPFAPALMKVSQQRARCDFDGSENENEESNEVCGCDAPSWVAEWSEEGGLRELYKGYAICTSTTAVRDVGRGVGMVSGLYDHGIMLFTE